MPLLDLLHDRARITPDAPFLLESERILSYGETAAAVSRCAARLAALGVEPGHRVVLALPNSIGYCIATYAVMHAGALAVMVNPRWTAHEINAAVRLTDPSLVIADRADLEKSTVTLNDVLNAASQPMDRRHAPAGEGMLLMTSGTTGEAKAVVLGLDAIATNALQMVERKQITERDRFLCSLPMFHSNGQIAALQSMLAGGASLAILDKFTPASLLESAARFRATAISGVPTLYQILLAHHQEHPVDLSSLRLCTSGAAPMPQSLAEQIEAQFGARLIEGYGLSEVCAGACGTPLGLRKPGSVGLPLPKTEIRVVNDQGNDLQQGEIGELWIRGPQIMRGYFRDPAATATVLQNGWLRTGDLARADEDGFYWIKGRKKELIIRSGFNVYPSEVENVLRGIEGIDDVAVVGLPHPVHGEDVHAAVVSTLPPADLAVKILERSVERLAGYKRPASFSVHQDLPRTGSLKVRKVDITALLAAEPHRIFATS